MKEETKQLADDLFGMLHQEHKLAVIAAFLKAATRELYGHKLANDGQWVIAVLQRGWVVVGRYQQMGLIGRLSDAAVVRRWGTAEGLGELARKGPLEDTILDSCPPVTFCAQEAVMIMECGDAWE